MPALNLFGRRWLIAGDDLVVPALQLSLFHMVWMVTLSIWLSKSETVNDCDEKAYYTGVVGATLATCIVSVVLEPIIAWYSSRGSLFETHKRDKLPLVIYSDLVMSVFRVVITIYGTVVLYKKSGDCLLNSGTSFNLLRCYEAMLWCMWAMIGALATFCLLCYNFFPDYSNLKTWRNQFVYLSYWFCCVSGSRSELHETFGHLGELIGNVLGHTDTTLTDILIIFYLSMMRQRISRYEEILEKDQPQNGSVLNDMEQGAHSISGRLSFSVSESRRESLKRYDSKGRLECDNEGMVDHSMLQEAAYYMKYAFAAYGWMLYVWAHPWTGMAALCCGRSCSIFPDMIKMKAGIPLKDVGKAPYLNREAILRASGLKPKDILLIRLEGDGKNVLPYFIGLDHAKKKIIISIRGSMSFDDVVTDLKYEPVAVTPDLMIDSQQECATAPGTFSMEADHDNDFRAHRGIYEASVETIKDIHRTGILEELLSKHGGSHKEYDILVCGHSLGAGCAFFVALHLRNKYKTVQCFSFSPPGGLVSPELSKSSREWCISTVCGKEVIPRLTLGTIEHLRDDMIYMGMHCKRSKISLIISMITGYIWSDPDLFYGDENLPEEQRMWKEAYQESLDADSEIRRSLKEAISFLPPGRILYMKPTGKMRQSRRRKKISREFECEWCTPDALVSNGIILSGRMMRDHFPDYSYNLLKKLSKIPWSPEASATRIFMEDEIEEEESHSFKRV